MDETVEVTSALRTARSGDVRPLQEVMTRLHEQLKEIARQQMAKERAGHTLQATAILNEAYIRLADARQLDVNDQGRFFAAAANVMRRILVDHARTRNREKRGGEWKRVTMSGVEPAAAVAAAGPSSDEVDLEALDDAMQELAKLSPRSAQVVELRFFGGLTVEQTADALKVSPRTVHDDWVTARAWLRRRLGERKD